MEALLDGGKNGVDVGLAIIPGVLAICTVVMILQMDLPQTVFTQVLLTRELHCCHRLEKNCSLSYLHYLVSLHHQQYSARSQH